VNPFDAQGKPVQVVRCLLTNGRVAVLTLALFDGTFLILHLAQRPAAPPGAMNHQHLLVID
jgi:hypothetical protein